MLKGTTTFRLVDTAVVAADPPLVERFLLDPGCLRRWNPIPERNYQVSTAVLQLGTSIESTVRVGPLHFSFVNIVSDHVPGRRLGMRTTKGVVDLLVTITWEQVEGGTRIEKIVDGRFTESKAWLWHLLEPAARRSARHALETLRRMIETGDYEFTAPSQLTPHPPRCPLESPPDFF
ncbi:UNVERIFIED_CONTAM: SRPBCC family protein [Kocuria sp. CPCC 205316]|uniref:SRPBCC family protein n=1 Tax=Kocuria TaxID=57493 RepID=UPI0036D7E16C